MVNFPSRPSVAYGDVSGYAELLRPLITPWYSGYIHIFDPLQNTKSTDWENGTKTVVLHPYWDGPTRIQPIRRNLNNKETTNDTQSRTIQFQLGYAKDGTLPDVKPGHQIVVTDGGNNVLLTLYQYVITGTINSSQAWQHTIFAETNLEARPNYTIEAL